MKHIPSRLDLRFRERETSQILQSFLMDNARIYSLSGLQGIGKSSLAREASHFAAERKMFQRGQLFIQCKGIGIFHNLLKLILRAILRIVDMSSEERDMIVT